MKSVSEIRAARVSRLSRALGKVGESAYRDQEVAQCLIDEYLDEVVAEERISGADAEYLSHHLMRFLTRVRD